MTRLFEVIQRPCDSLKDSFHSLQRHQLICDLAVSIVQHQFYCNGSLSIKHSDRKLFGHIALFSVYTQRFQQAKSIRFLSSVTSIQTGNIDSQSEQRKQGLGKS